MSACANPELMLDEIGSAAPTDNQLKSLLFWCREGRNGIRNEAILFLQLVGFRISETARVTVENMMWPSGLWRDIIQLPAAICKNGTANQIVFVNKRARTAADNWASYRLKKKLRIDRKSKLFRGLQPHSEFVLAEGGRSFSLKKKYRTLTNGEPVEYWAADTLQNLFASWCNNAGFGDQISSHCGRKALASRLAKNPITGREDIISVLIRHADEEMIFKYVKESGKPASRLTDLFNELGED